MTIALNEIPLVLEKIRNDPYFKGAFGRSLTRILYLNQLVKKELRHKICNDNVVTIPVVIYTQKDFYLLDEINEKLRNMIAAGLINFWYKQVVDETKSKEDHQVQPRVLTMNDLFGCFEILICGCAISLVALLIEIISRKVKDLRRKTRTTLRIRHWIN